MDTIRLDMELTDDQFVVWLTSFEVLAFITAQPGIEYAGRVLALAAHDGQEIPTRHLRTFVEWLDWLIAAGSEALDNTADDDDDIDTETRGRAVRGLDKWNDLRSKFRDLAAEHGV